MKTLRGKSFWIVLMYLVYETYHEHCISFSFWLFLLITHCKNESVISTMQIVLLVAILPSKLQNHYLLSILISVS